MNLLFKDLKLIIKPKKILLTIIIYLMIFLSFSYFYNDYMSEKRLLDQVTIGLVDRENSFLSDMLVENFKSNEEFSSLFNLIIEEEDLLVQAYENNELSAIVYIPNDFTSSLLNFDNRPLEMILNPNFPLQNTVLQNIMTSYSEYIKAVDIGIYSLYNSLKGEVSSETLSSINEQFSLNMVMTALGRNSIFSYKAIETFPAATSSEYFIFSIIVLVVIFTSIASSNGLVEEKNAFTLQRYLTNGHSMVTFLLSKITALSLNSLISLVPLLIASRFIVALEWHAYIMLWVLIMCVIGFFSTLSLLMGVLFNEVSSLMTSIFVMFLGIIGGQFIPIPVMPKIIQDISSYTPNYWIIRSCLYLDQADLSYAVLTTGVLMSLSLFIMIILSFIIRRQHA